MARRGTGGLQTNPLAHLMEDEEREEAAIVAAAQAAGAVVRDLPVNEVEPDPENPLSRLKPRPELVHSIKVEGQLVAGAVVPLNVWAGYGNDPAKLYAARETRLNGAKIKDEIKYVIVWGHSRWAGCVEAGHSTYKAVVTDTIKDNTTKRVHRLIENVQRSDLTPLEEAEEFQRLITEDKLSQHEISRRTGIPQPYISKRLGLRELPDDAKQALAENGITVETAIALSQMADDPNRVKDAFTQIISIPIDGKTDEQRQANRERRNRFAHDVVRTAKAAYESAKASAKLRRKLKAEGVTIIDDVREHFKDKQHPRWRYQLHGDDAITAARKAGTALAYVYSRDQVEWYTSEEPQDPQEPAEVDPEPTNTAAGADIPAPRSRATTTTVKETEEQREQREARERKRREKAAADEARAAACVRIASKAPRDQLTARLARRVLMCEDTYDHTAQELAATWLKAARIVDAEIKTHMLFNDKLDLDAKGVARVAYVYDLALDEARIRDSDGFDRQDAEHIERLNKEAGYTPTAWEQERLDELAKEAN